MAEKITYIFGAGASAQALPLAKSVWREDIRLGPKIPGLAYELLNFDFGYLDNLPSKNSQNTKSTKSQIFKKISKQADIFGDVDTYAKYLHLLNPGGEELQELKQALSEYFVIKQNIMKAIDPRYLPWLVSIMDKKRFPENIKILSWNYDFQIELAAGKIEALEEISYNGPVISYQPSFLSYLPNLDPSFSDQGQLSLIHLNGTAGFAKGGKSGTACAFQKGIKNSKRDLISFIDSNQLNSQIHFAWEGGGHHNSLMAYVNPMIIDSTILVIIGYSFPFFNRQIDKEIFKTIKQYSNLKKIYYQDPVLTGQQLKSQFDLDNDLDIIHISNVKNFHIPFEF